MHEETGKEARARQSGMRADHWLVWVGSLTIRGIIIGCLAAYLFFGLQGCATREYTRQEQCHRDHRNACEAELFDAHRDSLKVGVLDSGQILAFCHKYADTMCPVLP